MNQSSLTPLILLFEKLLKGVETLGKKSLIFLFLFVNNVALSSTIVIEKEEMLSSDKSSFLNETRVISTKINELNSEITLISDKQRRIKAAIENNIEIQKKLNKDTIYLLELLKERSAEIEPVNIQVNQPIDYSIFALPLVTLIIVISGTFLSIRTISIKSKESLDALKDSNQNQHTMHQADIEAQRNRSRELIIFESRQKWINILRDDMSSLLSNLSIYKTTSGKERIRVFDQLWMEFYKIQLLLNPKEEAHNELIEAIYKILEESQNDDVTDEFVKSQRVVLELSKKLLKQEWERTKKFH